MMLSALLLLVQYILHMNKGRKKEETGGDYPENARSKHTKDLKQRGRQWAGCVVVN